MAELSIGPRIRRAVRAEPLLQTEEDGTITTEDGETQPGTGRGRGRIDGEVWPQSRPVQGTPALGGGPSHVGGF